jgi:hypothetical protein
MLEAGPDLARELITFCREHLSPIKCPRSIDFLPELPRSSTGKLCKRLLRDRYWTGGHVPGSEAEPSATECVPVSPERTPCTLGWSLQSGHGRRASGRALTVWADYRDE